MDKRIISQLCGIFERDSEYKAFREVFKAQTEAKNKKPILINGLCEGAEDAFLVSSIRATDGCALVICANERDCRKKNELFERFGLRSEFYITRDLNFFNIVASRDYEHERLRVLYRLYEGSLDCIVTTPDALLGYVPSPEAFAESLTKMELGGELDPGELCMMLEQAGYTHCDTVEGIGQYAHRGGIVDIFPAFIQGNGEFHKTTPVRIEFFGDEIDRIVTFDPISQRSVTSLDTLTVPPSKELIITPEARERIRKEIVAQQKRAKTTEASELLRGELSVCECGLEINFADKYITSVITGRTTILDHIGKVSAVYEINRSAVNERLAASIKRQFAECEAMVNDGTLAPKNTDVFAPESRISEFSAKSVHVMLESFTQTGGGIKLAAYITFKSRHTPSYRDGFDLLCEDIDGYIKSGFSIIVLSDNESTARTLEGRLTERDYMLCPDGTLIPGTLSVIHGAYISPYELSGAKVVILSELEGERRVRADNKDAAKLRRRKGSADKISTFTELKEGDYVVHESYGIGIYQGIERMSSNGAMKDYIKVKYAGTDALFLPIDKLDKLSKYIGGSSDEMNVKLSRIGGKEWSKATAKAKASAKEIAKDLIQLYALRSRRPGFSFPPDDDYQKSFDDAFEYDETAAQLEAIDEIKIDMMKTQPMDRLLCGDVGFGKTEIALRAAYKAILGGKQVALLVPTTILALQHYNTAIARMRPFSVNVEMISRFRKPKEQAEILRKLRRGEIDLIIGTHRLISKDIEFADLGLLIVDEEQRFGVKQKERIKQMTESVDVLTLTATPIPRTLNMAMGGIRDISVLDEAPGERLPIQTYVMEHDDAVIEDAIRKEMRRGGQVFYLFNTVDTIASVARKISERIPEARVVYAHGKMEKEELEKIWAEMLLGELAVLISTTIIETGVDIPNANTLIVENAQNLGLSQLHQLRGRVGRSSRRAYAYFTFPKGKALSEIAAKRLGAIKEYAQFGAGFKIAMRDLEIRGAGNLLGSEQSGHLNAVGYELFIKLLKEAVLEEKGELVPEKRECVVNLDFDALLPEKYVSSPASRMSLYKKIALIRSIYDVGDIVDELSDRFGDPPQPAMNLVHIAYMKALASSIGIRQIRGDKSRMTFTISDEDFNFEAWTEISDIFERQVRLSITGSETMQAIIREPNTAIATINKMFEKYLEILKSKR